MTLIDWQDDFNIGIESVDGEHRQLVAMINELHAAVADGAAIAAVVTALSDIYASIEAHFAAEEQFMRATRYMAFAEHKEDHEVLLDDIRDIINLARSEGSYAESRLSADLRYWFSEHFRTHDARLHQSAHSDD